MPSRQGRLRLVLPSPEANLNNAHDATRRQGLSIDGDNAYKRDLCDMIIGALAVGAQNSNPPPAGHLGQRFWDMAGRSASSTKKWSRRSVSLGK
ncbi:hypothetical protein [Pseudomonas sp. Z4-7]|uniref:hypothetical protein n=1 Tax=Pseudomonas sp. Z4-7 TaxID=2817413 RepID=UPI003DA9CFC9